jgi:hypothetical protein
VPNPGGGGTCRTVVVVIDAPLPETAVLRRPVTDAESRVASRGWWDSDADE